MRGAGRTGSEELGGDVGRYQPPGKMTRDSEGDGYGRVNVGAGDVSYGVDGGHYRKAEGEADAQRTYTTVRDLVDDYRPWAGEDQQKGTGELSGQTPHSGSSLRTDL